MMALRLVVVGVMAVTLTWPGSYSDSHWMFELRTAENRSVAVEAIGALSFLRDQSIESSNASAEFLLGDGSFGPLPAPLVADPCLKQAGMAELSRRGDSIMIDFTPHARD